MLLDANRSKLTIVKILKPDDFSKNYSSDNYLFIKDVSVLKSVKKID